MVRILLASLIFPVALQAQENDPMAMQRCVWSCLANATGNTDPAYHQCVSRHCKELEPARPASPALPQLWRQGIASDGVTRFAGVDTPAGDGSGFYYMCDGRGQGYLMLYAADLPPGQVDLYVGAQKFPALFDLRRLRLTTDVAPASPFMTRLRAASAHDRLSVVDGRGHTVMQVGLQGVGAALHGVLAACGY